MTSKAAEVVTETAVAQEPPEWMKDLLAERKAEMSLTTRVDQREATYINALARLEDATAILERRAAMLSSLRKMAIRETNPIDWIMGKSKLDGREVAMPGKTACDKIADVYGIELFSLAPVQDGIFQPDVLIDEQDRATLRAWCGARSQATGREIPAPMIEAARRDDEKFLGREDHPADHRSAVLTLLRTKAARVISGLSAVPKQQLIEAWEGTGKNVEECTKGHGYGTSTERAATKVADEGVADPAKDLGKEIMARVGGDTDLAKGLLRELTMNSKSNPPFKGFDSIARFTKSWQVENAWKALRIHKTFGDKAIGVPAGGSAVEAE